MTTNGRVLPPPAPANRAVVRRAVSGSVPRSGPADADAAKLLRFVLLSMALHTLVVLLFGTASTGGGGSRRGDGAAGPLEVTLRAPGTASVAGFRAAPGADARSDDAPRTRRPIGAPPAATTPPVRSPDDASGAEPAPAPATVPAAPPIAPPVTAPVPATPPADAAPVIEREAAESADRPLAPVAPLERVTAPSVPGELAPPVELRAPERPTIPATPLERVTAPSVQRDLAPPVELRAPERPTIPATPLERVTAPSAPRDLAPPVELETPERAPLPAAAPSRTPPGVPAAAAPAAPAATTPAPDRGTPPAGEPRLRFATPDPGDEIFQPRTDVMKPSAEPGGTPRLDLDAARRRAREITSEGSGRRGLVPVVPPPAERRNKLAEDIDKAAKPDCRNAYQGMGLLAAIPLIAGAITDSPCRW